MQRKQIRFTQQGFEKLQHDYAVLLSKRPAAVLDLQKAREMGDLSENGYYKASRAKLSFLDRQIRQTSTALKQAVVVAKSSTGRVSIGSVVGLLGENGEKTFTIVGDIEADPRAGKLSLLSPLGKSLAGKSAGEEVVITTPGGDRQYKILTIS